MPEPARHLHLVDVETGEVVDDDSIACPLCQDRLDVIAGLTRDVRAEHLRYENLKRDKAAEMRKDPLWPKAVELFSYWKDRCRHPRSTLTPDRFALVEPYLREHGLETCKRAVDGAAFDPFVTKRKNGTAKRHDGLDLIFRNADKFEEFVNRAPPGGVAQPKGNS